MALTKRQKLVLWWWWKKRSIKKCRYRQFSVHPINISRKCYGEFHHLMPQLLSDTKKFVEYFRMTQDMFNDLLELCGADIEKKQSNFGQPISPNERLVITLRFLATGESFRSLAFRFRIGVTTIHRIVKETVVVLWKKLQPLYMRAPDEATWVKTAEDFYKDCNLPLCVGAIDGKHVQLKAPVCSGSQYHNYKGHFSIVLMAVADSKGKFIVIDVGGYGSCSDGGIFKDSSFFRLLNANKLHLPKPAKIPNTDNELPHVFVGDEAFGLMPNLMRPFPRRLLNNDKRIFNYRLSRARRQVECAFGIASSVWRVLRKSMEVDPDFAINIVKAVCVLHNYTLGKESHYLAATRGMQADNEGQWDSLPPNNRGTERTKEASAVRDSFMRYFVSPKGSLSWQDNLLK